MSEKEEKKIKVGRVRKYGARVVVHDGCKCMECVMCGCECDGLHANKPTHAYIHIH